MGRRFALDPGNLDHPALVTVERAEQRIDLKPVNTVITGVPDRYDPSKRVAAGFFGVEPEVVRQRGGPIAVVGDMWQMTKQTAVVSAYFPAKVYYTAYNLVTGKPRDIYGPMSIVGASRAAGEIASTDQIDAGREGREPVHRAWRGQPVRRALQLRAAVALTVGMSPQHSTKLSDGPLLASSDGPTPDPVDTADCCPWRTWSAG